MSPALPLILIEGGKEDIPVKYSDKRRKAVLAKLAPPQSRTVKEVAEEEGISVATIYNWRRDARQRGELLPDGASGPEGWTARDKFAAVIETASMNEAERSEYCRTRGVYPEHLAAWRSACERANDWAEERGRMAMEADREKKKTYP
jgi:transposase-like protein